MHAILTLELTRGTEGLLVNLNLPYAEKHMQSKLQSNRGEIAHIPAPKLQFIHNTDLSNHCDKVLYVVIKTRQAPAPNITPYVINSK